MIDRGSLASIITGNPSADYVIRFAACGFDVTIEELVSDSRAQPLCGYRQVLMAGLRNMTGLSFPAIGRRFNRDHTTVMNACERCRKVPAMKRALEHLTVAVQHQWAVDNGRDMPMPGQEVLAL